MPVTTRLSKNFYDTFGEDLAQEMVDWFNLVDTTYRADLRELNELNFARFDAKLEQRIAEVKTELRREIAGLAATMDNRFTAQSAQIAILGEQIQRTRADMIKWMFLFWAGSVLAVLGLASRIF